MLHHHWFYIMTTPHSFGSIELANRIGIDFLSGIICGIVVAPVLATVDKAVVENASGKTSLTQSVKNSICEIARNPFIYMSSFEFLWILCVYGMTYMAFNATDSLCKIFHVNDILPKLFFVTLVNMAASIMKDRAFAQKFGVSEKQKVRAISLLIWFVRDVMTIASAFLLPPVVAVMLEGYGMSSGHAINFSQLICPIIMQLILTPLHLLGLDLSNFPEDTARVRILRLFKLYPFTTFLRMIRMGIAYGVGGVGNKYVRGSLHTMNEGVDWDNRY